MAQILGHRLGAGLHVQFLVHAPKIGADGVNADLQLVGDLFLDRYLEIDPGMHELSIETGIGVGLHLGEVALGNLGPPGQKQMTLVGDTVNVAARLCSRARAGEVLLSCTVASALDADAAITVRDVKTIPFLQLPKFELRGRTAPLDIWCVPATERLAF